MRALFAPATHARSTLERKAMGINSAAPTTSHATLAARALCREALAALSLTLCVIRALSTARAVTAPTKSVRKAGYAHPREH